jgi:hypothetical protein
MVKTFIYTNNPSYNDWFLEMLFWPYHTPSMAIDGSQTLIQGIENLGLTKGIKNLI